MRGDITDVGDFSSFSLREKKASGGAGEIWTIKKHPNFVAKIYHNHVDFSDYEKKIRAMIDNKPDFETHELFGKLYPECTWPISRIEDSGKFKGYIMPQIDFSSSATLGRFLNKKSRDVDGLTGFLGHRFTIAHNLALNVSKIHQRNHLIVDLKPQNILIQKQELFVSVLDTDGFTIVSEDGETFPAQQFTPEYVAPEFIKKRPQDATIEQDLFSLAVIIFRLINNGIHPFQAGMKRSQKTIQEMVELKYYAYGERGPGNLIPSKFSEHHYWPEELLETFEKAFKSKERPTAKDWQNLMLKYTSPSFGVVDRCDVDSNHLKYNGICSQCELQESLEYAYSLRNNQSRGGSVDTSSFSKRLKQEPVFPSKYSSSRRKKINQNMTTPAQTNTKPRSGNQTNTKPVKKIIKNRLIKRSLIYGIIAYAIVAFLMNSILDTPLSLAEYFDNKFNGEFAKEELWFSAFWILLWSLFFYIIGRGRPARDCPSCGAFAGSLKLTDKEKVFVGYKYETKSGRADRRYKNNPEMFSFSSTWHCPYCDANIGMQHEISANPTVYTKIKQKTLKSSSKKNSNVASASQALNNNSNSVSFSQASATSITSGFLSPVKAIWYILCLPGYVIIWFNFFFPTEWGKKRNVARSGRAYRNKHVMAPIYAAGFYFIMLMIINSE